MSTKTHTTNGSLRNEHWSRLLIIPEVSLPHSLWQAAGIHCPYI